MYRVLSPRQTHNSTNRVGEELHGSRNSSSSSSRSSRSLFKFTEKHDKDHETDNKAHTQAPRMYTPKYFEPHKIIEIN